jgi:hypothetical protein
VKTPPIPDNEHRRSDEEIVLGIQEVPPSQAMEMGKIMSDAAAP